MQLWWTRKALFPRGASKEQRQKQRYSEPQKAETGQSQNEKPGETSTGSEIHNVTEIFKALEKQVKELNKS